MGGRVAVEGRFKPFLKTILGGRAEPGRVVRSRRLLMMGRPGTGETLMIGHILGRLAGCRRYLFVPAAVAELDTPGRRFEDLIRHIGAHPSPAVVVVEDVDRLFHAGTVTPQYFLNVLGGMLRPAARPPCGSRPATTRPSCL